VKFDPTRYSAIMRRRAAAPCLARCLFAVLLAAVLLAVPSDGKRSQFRKTVRATDAVTPSRRVTRLTPPVSAGRRLRRLIVCLIAW
jgi:hypothetical protein